MQFLGKLRHAGALLLAGTILTGCAINTGESHPDISAEPTADDGGSGDAAHESADAGVAGTPISAEPVIPPLGEFNRSDPDYIQYKPCLEIPDSFLVEARLFDKQIMEGAGEVDGICMFASEDEHGKAVFKVQGSRHNFTAIQRLTGEVTWEETSNGDPILIHRDGYLPESDCQAVVETRRGTFGVTFQSFEYGNENYGFDPCHEAQTKLKTILKLDGKHEN